MSHMSKSDIVISRCLGAVILLSVFAFVGAAVCQLELPTNLQGNHSYDTLEPSKPKLSQDQIMQRFIDEQNKPRTFKQEWDRQAAGR